MSCPRCFGCSPLCSNRHEGRPVRDPIKKCPACGRANPPENQICKRCNADLANDQSKSDGSPLRCLYTGLFCESPCSLYKVINYNGEAVLCPRGFKTFNTGG